jgi:coenzyme F420-dependent glucose-6-phosphate dehydrogenase
MTDDVFVANRTVAFWVVSVAVGCPSFAVPDVPILPGVPFALLAVVSTLTSTSFFTEPTVMRALWAGETVTLRGHTTTSAARLYSRPAAPPLLFGAALTAETARWVGSWADGLITVAGPRADMCAVVDAFRHGGGAMKPMVLQVTMSFARTDDECVAAAYDQWRQCALTPAQLADLDGPVAFDRACANVAIADVLSHVRASADIQRHIGWLADDAALGFDRIYLHNVASAYQERFIQACGTHLLPAFAQRSNWERV